MTLGILSFMMTRKNFDYKPEMNNMIIFPGYLNHEVIPYKERNQECHWLWNWSVTNMFEVIDDFVNQSDVETIYDAFTDSRCDWHLAKDHDESKNRKRYFVKVFKVVVRCQIFYPRMNFKRIHQRIKEFVPKTDVLRRIYFNCVKPGDGSEYHKDFDGKSVLIYANPTWKWY